MIRCVLDGGSSIYEALVAAFWSDPASDLSISAKSNLCKCSCATEIIQVFGAILLQWSVIDLSMTARRNSLLTMCATDNRKTLAVFISESSPVQCAANSLSISITVLTPNATVPAGSLIVITGLDAYAPVLGLSPQLSSPAILAGFEWSPASFDQNCLCSDKSQCNRTGLVQGSRCTVWSQSDSVLTLTSGFPFRSTVVTVNLENGAAKQAPPQVTVEIDGAGFYSPPTAAVSSQPIEVLSFGTTPSLGLVTVSEDLPDFFDLSAGIWRGSAPGQRNTLKFTIQPNIDVFPGTLITIWGLVRSGNASAITPTIRQLTGLLTNISVYSWDPADGIIVLVISSANADSTLVVGSMQTISFGLEFITPCQSSVLGPSCPAGPVSGYPNLMIEASRLGPRKTCYSPMQTIAGQVLVPRQTSMPFFPNITITASTCFPGECNTLTVLISVNQCIFGTDNMYILFSGLIGMDSDAKCSSGCNRDSSSIQLQDGVSGSIYSTALYYINFTLLTYMIQDPINEIFSSPFLAKSGGVPGTESWAVWL